MRLGIWRFSAAPSDATEKNCNIGAIPHMHVLEHLLPIWLLVLTSLFILSHFWTTYTKFDTRCQRYIATCGENFYTGAHLHSRFLVTVHKNKQTNECPWSPLLKVENTIPTPKKKCNLTCNIKFTIPMYRKDIKTKIIKNQQVIIL